MRPSELCSSEEEGPCMHHIMKSNLWGLGMHSDEVLSSPHGAAVPLLQHGDRCHSTNFHPSSASQVVSPHTVQVWVRPRQLDRYTDDIQLSTVMEIQALTLTGAISQSEYRQVT